VHDVSVNGLVPAVREDVPHVVAELERRTPAIVEVWLTPASEPLDFLPGQFVLLEDRTRRAPPRSYSVANARRPDGGISLFVTRVPGGATSCWIHDELAIGDVVSLSGPYGTFVASPDASGPFLDLAAGSGLAPIRSLVETALVATPRCCLTVVFSARTGGDVLDRDRFAQHEANNPNLRFVRTLTRGPGPGPHGRIPLLLTELCGDLAGHEVFIAGAPGFVADCAAAAEAAGAAHSDVHTEAFFVEP
jgi:CDP-4-dehydro-6-deoxyglucose reductase